MITSSNQKTPWSQMRPTVGILPTITSDSSQRAIALEQIIPVFSAPYKRGLL
jgi:hypothetical protein